MKMIKIICFECNIEIEKPAKEINRQLRNGRKEFYCSMSCSKKTNATSHLRKYDKENKKNLIPDNRKDEYSYLKEHLRRAKRRSKDFNLTLSYLDKIWKKQEGRCVYTDVKLLQPNNTENYNYMASLDRIDNYKGYIEGNVQFISVSCNWLKNKCDDTHMKEFFKIIISKNLPI